MHVPNDLVVMPSPIHVNERNFDALFDSPWFTANTRPYVILVSRSDIGDVVTVTPDAVGIDTNACAISRVDENAKVFDGQFRIGV